MKSRSILTRTAFIRVFSGAFALGVFAFGGTAHAERNTYVYAIEHPFYGRIGTFTNVVDNAGDVTRMDSRLNVEVTVMGAVVFQQDAVASEVRHGDRLVSFRSVGHKNGEALEVSGEATEKGFAVTSPSGTVLAPANVAPSDPWAVKGPGTGVMVSTESGEVKNVEVSGGEASTVSIQGQATPARHFRIESSTSRDKWEVWMDDRGVPIKFRSLESGTMIDFVLGGSASPDGAVAENTSDQERMRVASTPFDVGARE